jgi:hypothetical protein
MAKFLRIALWNANGLVQHKDEIQLFLQQQQQQQQIYILFISAYHFTTKSYFKIPHYIMYHTNPSWWYCACGHSCNSKTDSHSELPKYEEDFLQATSIRVKTLPYELTVTAVYSPPKYNLNKDHYDLFFSHWAKDSWQEETIIVNTLFGDLV